MHFLLSWLCVFRRSKAVIYRDSINMHAEMLKHHCKILASGISSLLLQLVTIQLKLVYYSI